MKICHDFHIHTSLSLCADESATVENYLKNARDLGLTHLGFSNHFWDEKIKGATPFYVPQNFSHLLQLKPELARCADPQIKLYFGCETEYDPSRHDVTVTEETACQFDYILVPNSHTHLVMPRDFYQPYQKHVDFMIHAYEDILNSPVSRYITAIAHPFEAVGCPYDYTILIDRISNDCFKRLFSQTAEKGIAVEINVDSMHDKTDAQIASCSQMRMFQIAKECGCKFLFGSDAHNNKAHSSYSHADLVAALLELDESHILNIALM